MIDRLRDKGRPAKDLRPRGGRGNVRLFVAAYPPAEWAERASRLLGALPASVASALPSYRATAAGQIHLTLLFIGSVAPARVDEIAESVGRSAAGVPAFEPTPQRVVSLPKRGRESRLLAIETDAQPPLLELVRRLATRLASNARPDPADRYFPHLTLCRFRKPTRGVSVDEPIAGAGSDGAASIGVGLGSFAVGEIRLMRSVLLPTGAEHREVGRFGLG